MADEELDHFGQSYKELLELGRTTLKAMFALNGGSILAVLTYLGNMKLPPGANLFWPICFFVIGLALAPASMIVAYLMQLRLLEELRCEIAGRAYRNVHQKLLWLAVSFVVGSLIFFCIGAVSTAHQLTKSLPLNEPAQGKLEKPGRRP